MAHPHNAWQISSVCNSGFWRLEKGLWGKRVAVTKRLLDRWRWAGAVGVAQVATPNGVFPPQAQTPSLCPSPGKVEVQKPKVARLRHGQLCV